MTCSSARSPTRWSRFLARSWFFRARTLWPHVRARGRAARRPNPARDPPGNAGLGVRGGVERKVGGDPLRSNGRRTPEPDVANLGLVRPPLVYLSAIALGLAIHALWPVHFVPPSLGAPVGVFLTLVAVALFLFAVRTFRAAGTPVPGNRPATTIVRTGPYRFSRNPIYLAFSLLQLGLALWVNSLGLLIMLVPAIALMSFVVIPREERYLEARFPAEYVPYKASVRRWL